MTIFNKDIENLLNVTASKLSKQYDINSTTIPQKIYDLLDKKIVFKIKLNDYNIKEGFHNYTVMKTFEVDEKLENDYKINNLTEVNNFFFHSFEK